ncbi:hypothetical protein [Streptomyces sp. NPDC050856]|uniref:hypothetical protein n=1 Tax=Streptomyces sp. NPDC050856 TaxID=3154939 RepID=UPI0033E9E6A9
MDTGPRDLGNLSLAVGACALWAAVLLRSRSAAHSLEQRGLWLAGATAAAAMTLSLPPLTEAVMRADGPPHLVTLVRNLIGVCSAGAILHFVASITGRRRLRGVLLAGVGTVTTALLILAVTTRAHHRSGGSGPGGSVDERVYWLIVTSTHRTGLDTRAASFGGEDTGRPTALVHHPGSAADFVLGVRTTHADGPVRTEAVARDLRVSRQGAAASSSDTSVGPATCRVVKVATT